MISFFVVGIRILGFSYISGDKKNL